MEAYHPGMAATSVVRRIHNGVLEHEDDLPRLVQALAQGKEHRVPVYSIAMR